MTKLVVTKLPNLNLIVIKKEDTNRFFLTTSDSLIISIPNLATLLKYLVKNGMLDKKVLEGILSEIIE